MDRILPKGRVLAGLAAGVLAAGCGGGGGNGGEPPPAPVAPPTSGTYAWLLEADGATDALRYGLSLVHRDTPSVEWVIEAPSAVVSDARTVASGTVDAAAQTSSALTPYTLVYIVGGDVRRVSLVADGSAPADGVQRAGTSSACRFVLDALDQATSEATRFVVSTAGADGQCGSTDDGRAEVRLDAVLGLVFTPPSGELPLAPLRDPATLAPRGWLGATQAQVWNPPAGGSFAVRDAANAITSVLASTPAAALVESATGLAVIDFSGGTAFTDSPVPGVAAGGWKLIGHDADHYYVYRNSDGTTSATWSVLRITRTLPSAVTLAGGTGQLASVGMGTGHLYGTVLGAAQNRLLRISKLVPGSVTTTEAAPTSTVTTVVTSASGVHQLWRVSGVGTGTVGRELQFVDETGLVLYSSAAGGFPLAVMDEDTIDWRRSENRRRFVVADGYGDLAYSGASLVAFDAASRTAVTLGTLPSSADLGGGFVFANAGCGPTAVGAGFVARSDGGVVQAPSRAFSFDAGASGSLTLSSQQQ